MFIRSIGKVLLGVLPDKNIVRTCTQGGKTVTEVLDSTGRVLKKRVKLVDKGVKPSAEVEEVMKQTFPHHENFSVSTVTKNTTVFDDSLKGKQIRPASFECTDPNVPTTSEYTVSRNIVGEHNNQKNVLMRESAHIDNLFNGGVYNNEFAQKNPLWEGPWYKRDITLGYDDLSHVPRNGNFLDTIKIPLKIEHDTGAWRKPVILVKPQIPEFEASILGEDRLNGLKKLIDSSSYSYKGCYQKLINPSSLYN